MRLHFQAQTVTPNAFFTPAYILRYALPSAKILPSAYYKSGGRQGLLPCKAFNPTRALPLCERISVFRSYIRLPGLARFHSCTLVCQGQVQAMPLGARNLVSFPTFVQFVLPSHLGSEAVSKTCPDLSWFWFLTFCLVAIVTSFFLETFNCYLCNFASTTRTSSADLAKIKMSSAKRTSNNCRQDPNRYPALVRAICFLPITTHTKKYGVQSASYLKFGKQVKQLCSRG